MTDISDITEVEKVASSAFSLMEKAQNSEVVSNLRLGMVDIEKAEFNEKGGHKFLHIKINEDTEFWAIKTKDNKKILAVKEEESYLYFAVDEKNDKQLTVIGQEDMMAVMKAEALAPNQFIQNVHVSVNENGQKIDCQYDAQMAGDDFNTHISVSENNKKVAESNTSISSRHGTITSKGYNDNTAVQGTSHILKSDEMAEGVAFETRVVDGMAIVDDEIWQCKDGKLSLVGLVLDDAQQQGAKSIKIGGKKIAYQPASNLSSDELSLREDPSQWQEEKILKAMGSQRVTMEDIGDGVWNTTIRAQTKQDMQAQQSRGIDLHNPMVIARNLRFNMRLENEGDVLQKDGQKVASEQKITSVSSLPPAQMTSERR